MGMLPSLDSAIGEQLSALIERRGWRALSVNNGVRYADRDYVCGHVLLRVRNELGLIDLEVGSVESEESLRSASSFRDLLDPPPSGRWNLSLGAGWFIDENWDTVCAMVSSQNWRETVGQIDDWQRRVDRQHPR